MGSRTSAIFWTLFGASIPVAAAGIFWAARFALKRFVYKDEQVTADSDAELHFARTKATQKGRPTRVYMDGCFDMMHYGHANALRQAKALGDILVVGLIPDSEILRCKGPPVMEEKERYTLVEAVKWVDEIITGVPYDLHPDFMDELFTKHSIDYVIHGDDPCLLPDGTDAYEHAKRLGKFRMIKRTEGISTTDIVGRMLTCMRVNSLVKPDGDHEPFALAESFSLGAAMSDESIVVVSPFANGEPHEENPPPKASGVHHTTISRFLPTSRRLVQFSNGRGPPEGAKVVYIDGAWDVFHPGHVRILKEAKAQGSFLLVGIHSDPEVRERRGPHLPIMSVHERTLSVLACKYVDEVIIGAPSAITEDLLRTFNISLVVRGKVSETSHLGPEEPERYELARSRGIFQLLDSHSPASARGIIQRIVAKREQFEARNSRKVKSEEKYYSTDKAYMQEV